MEVPARINIVEQSAAQCRNEFFDSVDHGVMGFEIQPLSDLPEIDTVVPGVGSMLLVADHGFRETLFDLVDNHPFGVVVGVTPRIEYFERDRVGGRGQNTLDDVGEIPDMAIRSPCIWIIDQQFASLQTSRTNSLMVRSKRMRGDNPKAVANRRMVAV